MWVWISLPGEIPADKLWGHAVNFVGIRIMLGPALALVHCHCFPVALSVKLSSCCPLLWNEHPSHFVVQSSGCSLVTTNSEIVTRELAPHIHALWLLFTLKCYTDNLSLMTLFLSPRSLVVFILGAFANCENRLLASRLFFPHARTRLPLGGSSWTLLLDYFSKICR